VTYFLLLLSFLAVAVTQALAGGRQIALCLPGYALLALAAVLSWWPARRARIPHAATECLLAAVVFASYIAIRALFSPEEYLARRDLFTALSGLALYLLVALNLTSSRVRLLLVGGILALALADCAIGAVQFFKGLNFMPFPFLPRPDYGPRASGFYGYPNHFAGFLEMVFLMGLSVAVWSRCRAWIKLLVGYICGMCLLGMLATGSRGGYISITIGLLVFVLLSLVLIGKLGSGRVLGLLLAGIVLVGVVGWGVRQVVSKSWLIQSRAGETLTVDVTRMHLWQAAGKQFRLNPVVGTGSGTYLYYGRQFRSPAIHTDPVHVHNDYLELLAEYGILGIVAAAMFLETHLRQGWNSFTRRISQRTSQELNSNSLALTIGALSAAVSCLVHSLLDFNLHIPANVLVAAVIFGLLASPGEGPEVAGSEEDPGWPAFLRLLLPVLGILIAIRVLPTAPAEYYAEQTRTILSDWHRSVSAKPDIEIEALARRGLEWDPRNPELHFAIGEANSAQGDLATDPALQEAFDKRALEGYREAVALAPGDVRFILALGRTLDNLRRFSDSDPIFARALVLDPNGGSTHASMGIHWIEEGKFTEAAAEYHLAEKFGAWQAAKAGLSRVEKELKAKGGGAQLQPGSPDHPK